MSYRRPCSFSQFAIAAVVTGGMALMPARADAQPRYYVHPHYHYGGWWYPWGPYPYPYPYYPGYWYADELTASMRLEVTPRDAQVFVDGYAAGNIDDFDGLFQRLRLKPGAHDLVIYHPQFRTVTEHVYLNRGAGQKMKFTMAPLAPGEVAASPPSPPETAPDAPQPARPDQPYAREPREPREAPMRFGTLALKVQPADAQILIDGERWTGTATERERLMIRVAVGRHRLEITKDGFERYTEDILVQSGRTLTLNVTLR